MTRDTDTAAIARHIDRITADLVEQARAVAVHAVGAIMTITSFLPSARHAPSHRRGVLRCVSSGAVAAIAFKAEYCARGNGSG